MIKAVSKTARIKERLAKEEKLRTLDTPRDIEAAVAMNKQMQQVRRSYKVKERNSIVSAAKVVLTA